MSLFLKKRKKNIDDGGDELLERINGKSVKYVAEHTSDHGEVILGKDGRIVVTETEIVVMCSAHEVFRCLIEGSKCGELLNLEGVRLSGINRLGENVSVIAHYTYYRK